MSLNGIGLADDVGALGTTEPNPELTLPGCDVDLVGTHPTRAITVSRVIPSMINTLAFLDCIYFLEFFCALINKTQKLFIGYPGTLVYFLALLIG